MQSLKPGMRLFEVANAQHHVFLDQPIEFVRVLGSILNDWGRDVPGDDVLISDR